MTFNCNRDPNEIASDPLQEARAVTRGVNVQRRTRHYLPLLRLLKATIN